MIRRGGRVAEGDGLLNRYTGLNPYRGFESLPLRHFIFSRMRYTQRKGDLAVAQAISTFTSLGYDVALPFTESAAYDLIVDTGKVLKRVQVRYSSNGEVDLRRIHSNSKGYVVKKTRENAYDWLYVLNGKGEEYLIQCCLSGRRSVQPQPEHKLLRRGARVV